MSAFTASVHDDLHDGLVLPFARAAAPAISRRRRWAGRVLSGLVVAFLLFDSGIKLIDHPAVAAGARELGYAPTSMFGIGALLLACTVLYLIPRFSLVGALMITGYLGGAIATHVRVGNPLFSHTLFPIYVAALVWGGLYLRDTRVRALFAPRQVYNARHG
jgi:hypothetical protein